MAPPAERPETVKEPPSIVWGSKIYFTLINLRLFSSRFFFLHYFDVVVMYWQQKTSLKGNLYNHSYLPDSFFKLELFI